MTNPYTQHPLDAFMAAETSVAMAMTAVLLFKRAWPALTRALLFAALFVAVTAPVAGELVHGLGYDWPADRYLTLLDVAAALATLAMVPASPKWLLGLALVGEYGLYRGTHFLVDQALALSALHVAWIGGLFGFLLLAEDPPREPAPSSTERGLLFDDLTLAVVATVLAAVVGTVVLKRQCDSADEWAYTFQASVYAKLHAYSVRPPCYEAFRAFWVFEKDGRLFSQYLPGWPLFMAPFFAAGVFWLAGPCALGVLVVGIARLARRAAGASVEARATNAERQVRIAGLLAGAVLVLSDTVLINAGSRFPHIWVCAMFVWAMEAICIVTSAPSPRRQVGWGVVLGCSLAWLLATRHVDGALLGVGMFLYVLYAFVRGRLHLRTAIATLVPFALFGGLTLVLLRLQLGKWFTTGYSLTEIIHPWNKGASALSLPKPNEWRWSFPIDAGSYCWWPMAPAIGIAGGLALGRTRERRLAFMMGMGTMMNAGLYALLESCRGWDFGYGPRYHLVVIVPMAVGAAVVFAPMFNAALAHVARYTTLADGGAAALAATAALLGAIRIAPLVYPANTDDIRARNVVFDAIKNDHVSNAVVWVAKGQTVSDPLDLAQNLPIDLYGPQSVFVLRDLADPQLRNEARQCVKDTYPGRTWYHPTREAHLARE
jgi:hypothetical protein